MFLLAVIEDKLKTLPEQFDKDPTDVLIEQIDSKFANKVLLDVGLCVTHFDFLEIEDPYVYPAEGCAHQRIRFRMVVFRPFAGEILVGKIVSSNKDGIIVSLGFFEDVFIPSYLLQAPSEFKPETSLWVWKYGGEDDSSEFVMDIGEEVRFRVRTINFTRLTTSAKGVQATTTSEIHNSSSAAGGAPTALRRARSDTIGEGAEAVPAPSTFRRRSSSSLGLGDDSFPPVMQVVGCCNEDGLGLVSWWS